MAERILVVDDEPDQCVLMKRMLGRLGYVVDTCTSAYEAMLLIEQVDYDVVLTDLEMAGLSGIELSQRLTASAPGLPVVVVTAYASIESVAGAMRAGAFDYLTKPLDPRVLQARMIRAVRHRYLTGEIARLRVSAVEREKRSALRSRSASAGQLQSAVGRASDGDTPVLIVGESGTGKELIGRAIHKQGARAGRPFIALDCAAASTDILEGELFGRADGAGVSHAGEGLLVSAAGGTLFLDEVGDVALELQGKLLEALRARAVQPVGGAASVRFDARVIFATKLDPAVLAAKKRLLPELLAAAERVDVPPLRERKADVLELAAEFLDRFSARAGRAPMELSQQVAEYLLVYDWPGNVRELESCMERVVAIGRHGQTAIEDLPDEVQLYFRGQARLSAADSAANVVTLDELERLHIVRTLARAGGNKTRAADLLGLDRRTLYRKLEALARDGSHARLAASTESGSN
jgi:two-component system response regulator HydG